MVEKQIESEKIRMSIYLFPALILFVCLSSLPFLLWSIIFSLFHILTRLLLCLTLIVRSMCVVIMFRVYVIGLYI